ncbi:MAG: ParB family transcriptional regulator, chromosome partitioning protein [Bacillota bacterium]|nr:ParB family transcriptional regulator, chromosome partitioning protein [Bacillota bacterium]
MPDFSEQIVHIPCRLLTGHRTNFFSPAKESLDELAESIREVGVLHPLVVRPLGDGRYEIVSGHRRLMAAKIAGLEEVPCVVREMDDTEAELALIDANLETRQLSPMEMARAIRRRKELLGIRRGRPDSNSAQCAELSQKLGISERQLHKLDKLNDLIPELQALVDSGRLGVTAGERLASLAPDIQRALYEALGDEIASLTNEEVKRLKQENDRGWMVLEVYQEKIRQLEEKLREYEEKNMSVIELEEQISRLRQKKREMEYDLIDRENAIRAVEKRAAKKGVALLQLMEQLARPVQASKPDIEVLLQEPVNPGLAVHILRWAAVLKEVGSQVEQAVRTASGEKELPRAAGERSV